jgi:hypothetical protein
MLPFIDDAPIRRHETAVELTLDPGAAPDTVRAKLLKRAAVFVAAALGPASLEGKIVAEIEVILSMKGVGGPEIVDVVMPISIRFDAAEEHGEGIADWPPDILLNAVIRNELDRVWGAQRMERFVAQALATSWMDRSDFPGRTMSMAAELGPILTERCTATPAAAPI